MALVDRPTYAGPMHRTPGAGAAHRHTRITIGTVILAMAGAACGAAGQSPSPTFDPLASVDPQATLAPLPTGSGNQRGPLRFNRIAFNDPAAGGIAAISVLVPDGWSYEGGVQWLPTWRRGRANRRAT